LLHNFTQQGETFMPAIDPFEAERKALQSLMGENRFFIPDL
jgi:hypothetical protein